MVLLAAAALLAAACVHSYVPRSAHEQLACNEACVHYAGTMARTYLQSAWPLAEQQCACRFDDESTMVCARRRHRGDETPVCE